MRKGIVVLALAVVCLCAGCSEVGLRLAPTESQKQSAELTNELAQKVAREGTEPGSPAAVQLVEGTRAMVAYTGRAQTPADAEQFDTVTAQANQDAVDRPDPWQVADHLLELAIGVSGLVGGAYGLKAVRYLKTAREKSKALQEIVLGNEIFRKQTDDATWQKFKRAQGIQSTSTKTIVTEAKNGGA